MPIGRVCKASRSLEPGWKDLMTNTNDRNERNRLLIEEFGNNEGKVSGSFAERPLLLLSTTGAKTGQQRINPLMYLPDGDRWLVFASKGGAPTIPDWFHNLVAHPIVTVEVGTEAFEADATVITGEERDRLYAQQAQLYSMFAEYEQRTNPQDSGCSPHSQAVRPERPADGWPLCNRQQHFGWIGGTHDIRRDDRGDSPD